jgi:4-hydroxybenzoate polyprenyltransferase
MKKDVTDQSDVKAQDAHAGSDFIGYLKIARIDHWFKNVFMLPGTALALIFTGMPFSQAIIPTLIGILSVCFIASANYVINEWLDAEFDQHHPVKKNRPSVGNKLKAKYVYIEYAIFIVLGLGLGLLLPEEFMVFLVALLIMGVIYNVKPFRTKDRAYLDVLSESINNPLRFLLGWTAIVSGALPPSSALLAYWMGGAFLMGIKRYAEYRFIDDPERAGMYRKSFKVYTEEKLLISSFFYALSSAFFLGVFLIKYRIEFLLSFPLFALLFAWYLAIGMKPHSPTQNPEKLYKEKHFMIYIVFLCCAVTLLYFVDMPWLQVLVERIEY